MTSQNGLRSAVVSSSLLLAGFVGSVSRESPARAEVAPEAAPSVEATAPAPRPPMLGVGYKIGNGLGFLGADVVFAPLDHLSFDIQVNTFSVASGSETARGYGVAPAAHAEIFTAGRSTPYVGLGYVRCWLSLDDVHASVQGVFLNGGYEWKWSNGLGILLGGGASYVGKIEATDGVSTISRKGGLYPNLEAGLRFLFI